MSKYLIVRRPRPGWAIIDVDGKEQPWRHTVVHQGWTCVVSGAAIPPRALAYMPVRPSSYSPQPRIAASVIDDLTYGPDGSR